VCLSEEHSRNQRIFLKLLCRRALLLQWLWNYYHLQKILSLLQKEYPYEHDVTDEKPRIGVFVCHCGMNIAGTVDVEKVTESIKNEPGVVFASHTMYTCSEASLSNIKEQLVKYRLNRVVVASCTPRTHEPIFRETLRETGLNP